MILHRDPDIALDKLQLLAIIDRPTFVASSNEAAFAKLDDEALVRLFRCSPCEKGLTPFVEPAFYTAELHRNGLALAGMRDAVTHYLMSGDNRLSPHPLFAAEWYHREAQRDDESEINPLVHYCTIGWQRGHWPHPLFDPQHYREQCVARGMIVHSNPLAHYLRIGGRVNVSPHLLFDAQYYVAQLQQLGVTTDVPALVHFVQTGDAEGINPHPLFDVRFYRQQGALVHANSLVDYITDGQRRQKSIHPLFDTPWYIRQHSDAAEAFRRGIDPLTHYIREGAARDRSPSPSFDSDWYRRHWMAPSATETPLQCAIVDGLRPHQRISRNHIYDSSVGQIVAAPRRYVEATTPLVSIIIVNMDGAHHLEALFASLKCQTYDKFEVIFVDNASKDNSVDLVSKLYPATRIVSLAENNGFAQANNIGMEHCRGELIALLNNDTRADNDWLDEMVSCMRRHEQAAIVTPRVRFWTKFRDVKITSKKEFFLDNDKLLQSLSYKKYVLNKGFRCSNRIVSELSEDQHVVLIKVATGEDHAVLDLTGENRQACVVRIDDDYAVDLLLPITKMIVVSAASAQRPARYVINNAGGYAREWLTPGDIGLGEFDDGQLLSEREVEFGCGCAMMVRRSALGRQGLFVGDFVAYYEDSELSFRMRREGHSIVFCPSAIVYHRHSSTTTEKSQFWWKHVMRNKVVFQYLFTPKRRQHAFLHEEMMRLNHYKGWLEGQSDLSDDERSARAVIGDVMSSAKIFCQRIDAGVLAPPRLSRVGIYNRYWNTRGGGEAHALSIASYLAKWGPVELISDLDFDLESLLRYFNVSDARFVKRIIPPMSEEITEDYDIFLNSTFMSEVPSRAKHSFYIVSFPSRTPSAHFLRSYTFLANSDYTAKWMETYWGTDYRKELVEPSVAPELISDDITSKSKTILSVGRFFASGHSKNQLEIIRAYNALVDQGEARGWTLKLIGSVGDPDYFAAVQREAREGTTQLYPNASFSTVASLYKEAAIYVHASGLGRSLDDPSEFEHFGMTVAEACSNGCYPIVYDVGGPADLVRKIGTGATFRSLDELVEHLSVSIKSHSKRCALAKLIAKSAEHYSASNAERRIAEVFGDVIMGRQPMSVPCISDSAEVINEG